MVNKIIPLRILILSSLLCTVDVEIKCNLVQIDFKSRRGKVYYFGGFLLLPLLLVYNHACILHLSFSKGTCLSRFSFLEKSFAIMAFKNLVLTAISFLYMGGSLAAPVISDHSLVGHLLHSLVKIPNF